MQICSLLMSMIRKYDKMSYARAISNIVCYSQISEWNGKHMDLQNLDKFDLEVKRRSTGTRNMWVKTLAEVRKELL